MLTGSSTSAQTTTWKLTWDQPEAPAVANGAVYTLKVDAAAPSPLTVVCVAAVGVPGMLSTCTSPMPTLSNGSHTLVVTAANAFGSNASAPLAGAPPGTPFQLRITIQIGGN
jgi:hypothetical protein